jgi:mRNA-degrading endonuclease RelE of RelBE toxin-antitoxin system
MPAADRTLLTPIVAVGDNAPVKLIVSPTAAQTMQPKHMSARDATALLRKLGEFATDPFASHAWALPLVGKPNRARFRQGDWRAVVLIVRTEDAVIVERVEHRREAYR